MMLILTDEEILAEITALRAAMTAGVKRVVTQTNGVRKEVEYPSFDDLRKRYDWLIGQLSTAKPTRRVTLASL